MQTTNLTLNIYQDTDAESPRKWGPQGHMICWHNRYQLGDDHDYSNADEYLTDLLTESGCEEDEAEEIVNRSHTEAIEIISKTHVILPLYLYDHTGITMNTTGFSCKWDSGQVGWIHISHQEIKNLQEQINRKTQEPTQEYGEMILQSEVEIYDTYITGDVWYYTIEDENGNIIESLGDIYGEDNCIKEGEAAIQAHHTKSN